MLHFAHSPAFLPRLQLAGRRGLKGLTPGGSTPHRFVASRPGILSLSMLVFHFLILGGRTIIGASVTLQVVRFLCPISL